MDFGSKTILPFSARASNTSPMFSHADFVPDVLRNNHLVFIFYDNNSHDDS